VELVNFREKLKREAIEGLCDCVCVRVLEWLEDKVEQCRIELPVHLHFKRIYDPSTWKETVHEMERRGKLYQCSCPVSSSYVVFQVRPQTSSEVTNILRDVGLRFT